MASNEKKNLVMELLGTERIEQICKALGLDEAGRQKALEIIQKWEDVIAERGSGQINEKMNIAMNLLEGAPSRALIIKALGQIVTEFLAAAVIPKN